MPTQRYVGRFAPTPSGPLHIGSLLTATASWLDARAHGGRWLVRIDDLDTPRVSPGAEAEILDALTAHGLAWDGPIVHQRALRTRHRAALRRLGDRAFACRCPRRQLRGAAGCLGGCRHLNLPRAGNAVRVRTTGAAPGFEDRVRGRCDAALSADFVVWRRDDMAAYPLSVVVVASDMGVTHVVRGADLLANTPCQLHVAGLLGITPPAYAHIPVVVTGTGEKLSKHNQATTIDPGAARQNIATVLDLFDLTPPAGLVDPKQMLAWAVARWRVNRVPSAPRLEGFVAFE